MENKTFDATQAMYAADIVKMLQRIPHTAAAGKVVRRVWKILQAFMTTAGNE